MLEGGFLGLLTDIGGLIGAGTEKIGEAMSDHQEATGVGAFTFASLSVLRGAWRRVSSLIYSITNS